MSTIIPFHRKLFPAKSILLIYVHHRLRSKAVSGRQEPVGTAQVDLVLVQEGLDLKAERRRHESELAPSAQSEDPLSRIDRSGRSSASV